MPHNVSDCFNDSENYDFEYDDSKYEIDYETTFCGYNVVMLKDIKPTLHIVEHPINGKICKIPVWI